MSSVTSVASLPRLARSLHASRRGASRYAPSRSRCFAPVLAFRWGDSDPASDTTTAQKPSPPPVAPKLNNIGTSYNFNNSGNKNEGGERDPEDLALEEMRREEQIRDAQRAAAEAFGRVQTWWDSLPDKRSLLLGGAGLAVVAYLGNAVVGAVDRVPLLPRAFQAVGVGYSAWFWYRYVLFAAGRRELRARLGALGRSVVDKVDDLTEQTLESHPNPGTGETGAASTARKVVQRLAARHADSGSGGPTGQSQPTRDDGSWLDEPSANKDGADATDRYVNGLLQELDERDRAAPGGPGAGTGSGGVDGRSPIIFAMNVEMNGSEEGGGMGEQGESASSSAAASGEPEVGDLDPCLGWDTEACAATGHMKLGEPDKAKLDALADVALRQAREAVDFSKHVDQALHAPVTGSYPAVPSAASVEADLEGQYGRAAGEMEREEMERLAKQNPKKMTETAKSVRRPAMGEEAGTGP